MRIFQLLKSFCFTQNSFVSVVLLGRPNYDSRILVLVKWRHDAPMIAVCWNRITEAFHISGTDSAEQSLTFLHTSLISPKLLLLVPILYFWIPDEFFCFVNVV